jgi:hypothetical protein
VAEIKDEYIQWPGPATFPAETTFPAYDRSADGNTTVHSHKGWEWVESDNPFQKAAASLAQSTIEASIRRMRTVFGKVFYQKGNSTDKPGFPGETYGDTARIQDPSTLDIVAEWKWNGSDWERARVSGEQISNLDVGRLTAGSAAINDLAARRIAGDIGKFLQLTTDQLTVTGNASFVDLTAKHVWTRIINARSGEFEKIKAGMLAANSVTADNLRAGAIDGQVITGASIQTDRQNNRGLKIDNNGMRAYSSSGWKSLDINAHTGEISISGRIGRRDSWSECYFNDLVWAQTGTDVARSGAKIGCGLAFNSLEDDWDDGALFIQKDANTNEPSITLQSAARKGAESRPSLILGTQQASITVGPNGDWGSLAISKYGFTSKVNSSSLDFNDSGIAYRKTSDGGHAYFGLGRDWATLTTLGNKNSGMWVNNHATILAWRKYPQIWLDNDGIHMNPEKKFTMRVPKLTKERGGLWLSHACTESPYDGVEYWENLTLDGQGRARWELPNYVPRIASPVAPWVVFASGSATAEIDRSDPDLWAVTVTGEPGARVDVLVKGARMVNTGEDDADGEPIMKDNARKTNWELGPPGGGENTGGVSDDMTLPGTYYGPATKPEDWRDTDGAAE